MTGVLPNAPDRGCAAGILPTRSARRAHLFPLDRQLARSRLRIDHTPRLVAIMLRVDFVRGVEGEAKVVLRRLALFDLRVVRALESENRNQSAACPGPAVPRCAYRAHAHSVEELLLDNQTRRSRQQAATASRHRSRAVNGP